MLSQPAHAAASAPDGDPAAHLAQGLLDRGVISADALARARSIEADSDEDLATILTRLGIVSEQALVDFYGLTTGLPRVQAGEWPDSGQVIPAEQVSVAFLREHLVVPLRREGGVARGGNCRSAAPICSRRAGSADWDADNPPDRGAR